MPSSIMEKYESMAYGPAPEDTSKVTRWLDDHHRSFGHYIDGQFTAPIAGATFTTQNPATGEPLATIANGTADDVARAVASARAALPGWQALSGHARARFLYAFARQTQKHARKLAVLETLDNGKPIRESRDIDIPLVARHFYYHAGWAQNLAAAFPGYDAVGVVGQIIPWNFPLLMFAWKVAPALAAGCTVVIKPAEFTPLTAIALGEIAAEIGLPAGVLNVVNGDGRTGAAIAAHPGVDKIAFTGSTEVGRLIRKATAATSKKLSLELGGKSPFIVFDDADLDSAVEGLIDGIFFNQGQVCCAGSRLLVQERVADRLHDKLRARMATLRVGSPLDKTTDIGAIVDQVQFDRIQRLIATGTSEGATCWQPDIDMPTKGLFLKPTLLTGVAPASTVAQEEIFGPVLASLTFRTPADAVELANNTVYGLAASIWSENINVALDVAAQIKAGVVWVNATNVFDAACGFGGYRESGFGREGGREGMYEYLVPAWLHADGDGSTAETQIPFGNDNNKTDAAHLVTEPLATSEACEENTPALDSAAGFGIDTTAKLYINGKQARPDSGYSFPVHSLSGKLVGHAPLGSRKDVRNAVEAARAAAGKWARTPAHSRAQVLFYLAENLQQRRSELIAKLAAFVGGPQAIVEFDEAIERIFSYAGWADKYDGQVHNPPARMVAIAMNEALGTVGVVGPDEAPLLSFISLVLPNLAMGNAVVALFSERAATLISDIYQVLETSDLPPGVLNLIVGPTASLSKTLAEHDDLDALWIFRDADAVTAAKTAGIGNLKQVFSCDGRPVDWFDPAQAAGTYWLRHATQVKNIWVPYGE